MNGRWQHGTYIVGQTIVGIVQEDPFERGWWAYGCLSDWQDTPLGMHSTKLKAEQAVEGWVRNNA